MPIRAYKESEQELFMEEMERQEAPYARFRTTGRQEYGLPNSAGKYMLDVPSGMVDDLLEDGGRGFAIWRMDNALTSQSYGPQHSPYRIWTRRARSSWPWAATSGRPRSSIWGLSAGVVKAPFFGEPDAAQFGFDMATQMG
jgi:hypothetical protein